MVNVKKKSLIVACLSFVLLSCGTSKAENAAAEDEPAQIKVFVLQNAAAKQVLNLIDSIFGEETLRFAADERTNMVVVKGRPDTLAAMEAVLLRLDEAQAASQKRVAQPRIKARLKSAPPREVVELRSKIQGTAVIRSLVPAGTKVKKGDLLVELDDSKMIAVTDTLSAEIAVIQAELERAASQSAVGAESEVKTLEAELKIAQLRRTHFEAESELELLAAESEITVSAAAIEFTRTEHARLEQLAENGQANLGEVEAAALEATEARTAHELAKARKMLLVKHTRPLRLAELELEVQQHQWYLERARHELKAQKARSQAELKTLETQLMLKSRERVRLRDEIEKCKMFAPADGTVRHAGPRGRAGAVMLKEGAMVREGQPLILLELGSKGAAE